MDYVILLAELTAGHPDTGAYSEDAEIAAGQLNAVNREVNVESVTGQDLFEALDPAEFAVLTERQERRVLAICGFGTILVNGTNTRAALLAMFAAETQTRTNLAALQKRDVSRAVELGLGEVKVGNVLEVRRNA